MKRFILSLLLVAAFTLPQQAGAVSTGSVSRPPVPFEQIYREMQQILYGEYGGSATGIYIASAYIWDNYGLSLCDVWLLHDLVGYTGSI